MKRFAKKTALLLVLVIALTALFSVYASAEAADSVKNVTGKIGGYIDDIKDQFRFINDWLKGLLGDFAGYLILVVAVLLLVECFVSYRLLKVNTFIFGAYLGFACGLLGYTHLTAVMNVPGEYIKWIIAGLLALIFGFLFTAINRVGVVILTVAYTFITVTDWTDNLITQIVVTAVVLVLSVIFFRYIFIGASSIFCAHKGLTMLFSLATTSLSPISDIIAKIEPTQYLPGAPAKYVTLGIALVIAFFGILVQCKLLRRKKY